VGARACSALPAETTDLSKNAPTPKSVIYSYNTPALVSRKNPGKIRPAHTPARLRHSMAPAVRGPSDPRIAPWAQDGARRAPPWHILADAAVAGYRECECGQGWGMPRRPWGRGDCLRSARGDSSRGARRDIFDMTSERGDRSTSRAALGTHNPAPRGRTPAYLGETSPQAGACPTDWHSKWGEQSGCLRDGGGVQCVYVEISAHMFGGCAASARPRRGRRDERGARTTAALPTIRLSPSQPRGLGACEHAPTN